MSKEKWIFSWVALVFIMGAVPYAIISFILDSYYENTPYAKIVGDQVANSGIYGTALNQNTFGYKLELYKSIKPSVLVLGSSRVMQFREDSFNTKFVNAGGAMNHLNEGLMFLKESIDHHKPEIVILGLDFWWFNKKNYQPFNFPYHANTGDILNQTKLTNFFKFLFKGKIPISTIKDTLSSNRLINHYSEYKNLGFNALLNGRGFRKDGSYFYAKVIFENGDDVKFNDTLSRIRTGTNRFEHASHYSESRYGEYFEIRNFLKSKGIKLLVLFPPLAKIVRKEMEKYNYLYYSQLRQDVLKDLDTFDFHNGFDISNSDCEYKDGFHGGDIVYKRILKEMYDKNVSIRSYINIDKITNDISRFAGLAMTPEKGLKMKEIDFLKLGCPKEQ